MPPELIQSAFSRPVRWLSRSAYLLPKCDVLGSISRIYMVEWKNWLIDQAWGHTPLASVFGKQEQVDFCEFKANFVYIAISRPTKATYCGPVSAPPRKENWLMQVVFWSSCKPVSRDLSPLLSHTHTHTKWINKFLLWWCTSAIPAL